MLIGNLNRYLTVSKLKWKWKKYTSNTTMKITTSSKICKTKYDNSSYLLLCGEKLQETFQICFRIIPLTLIQATSVERFVYSTFFQWIYNLAENPVTKWFQQIFSFPFIIRES